MIYFKPGNCLGHYWKQCYLETWGAVSSSIFLTLHVTLLCIVCSDQHTHTRGGTFPGNMGQALILGNFFRKKLGNVHLFLNICKIFYIMDLNLKILLFCKSFVSFGIFSRERNADENKVHAGIRAHRLYRSGRDQV